MSHLTDELEAIRAELIALYHEAPELRAEVQSLRRHRAASRVRAAFTPLVRAYPNPYRGLGFLWVGGFARRSPGRAPLGWRWLKLWDRNAAILLPLWLYWPVRLWLDRYRLLFEPLYELGFWSLREGDLYVSGRWTWAWWQTLAAQRLEYAPYAALPVTRWERFGWALRNAVWCFVHDRDEALV